MNITKVIMVSILPLSIYALENNHIKEKVELFVDRHNISKIHNVSLLFHAPIEQPISKLPLKKSPFVTIVKYKKKFIAYYRANNKKYRGVHKTGYPDKVTKYAISKYGIDWTYPKDNIIIKEPPFTHNFSPFLDINPLNKNFKFKALAGVDDKLLKRLKLYPPSGKKFKSLNKLLEYWEYPENYESGLYSFGSNDGIHWFRTSGHPVITVPKGIKAFDSQNVSFWSETEDCYVCFFRTWKKTINKKNKVEWIREVSKTTSLDFKNWSKPIHIKANLKGEQIYTTQVHPYYRNPNIYISLATRFMSHRKGLTDIIFMSMRAGNNYFDRELKEAYIKPGLDLKRWKNRANYMALNVVQTNSKELSLYNTKSQHRYTLRIDGFASIHAGYKKGYILTKPFILNKNKLFVNFSSSAAGSLKVQIESNGKAIEGFRFKDSKILIGDKIKQKVEWKNSNLKSLKGKLIQIKFLMKECDLYSYTLL